MNLVYLPGACARCPSDLVCDRFDSSALLKYTVSLQMSMSMYLPLDLPPEFSSTDLQLRLGGIVNP